jgi:hypothetical protein
VDASFPRGTEVSEPAVSAIIDEPTDIAPQASLWQPTVKRAAIDCGYHWDVRGPPLETDGVGFGDFDGWSRAMGGSRAG